jgi:hypothetical protein
MTRSIAVLAAAVLALAAATANAASVSGSIAGPVTAVKGSSFKVKTSLSPTGTATVTVGKATRITEQVVAASSSLAKGACVAAIGTRTKAGVTARQITISAATNGQCTNGFGGRRPGGGQPPSGQQQPPRSGGFANFGGAFGQIVGVAGKTLTVRGTRGSTATTTKVTVSSATRLLTTKEVAASAVAVKACAFVFGTSSDKGVTITAQRISLSQPVNGGCGFRPS